VLCTEVGTFSVEENWKVITCKLPNNRTEAVHLPLHSLKVSGSNSDTGCVTVSINPQQAKEIAICTFILFEQSLIRDGNKFGPSWVKIP